MGKNELSYFFKKVNIITRDKEDPLLVVPPVINVE
jgi:hypothetical protein